MHAKDDSPVAYVTLLGRSPWPLINTYYSVLSRGKKPKVVYVFTEEKYSRTLRKVVEALELLSEAYGIEPFIETVVIPDDDFLDADKKFKEVFTSLSQAGYRIGLDITSGRKALVAAALVQVRDHPVDRIIYMALLDRDYPDRPYMMIPVHMQRMKNFLGRESFDGHG